VKLAIITPQQPLHHEHLCAYLARRHELVGVVHPNGHRSTSRVQRLRKELRDYGAGHAVLRALATVPGPLRGWDPAAWRAAIDERFAGAGEEYRALAAPVARSVDDVNGPEAIAHLRALAPDVVMCLGGPIYRPALIEAVPLMVNFHSGVSPLYNGASTIAFAFANGHPQLCGGTLMVMNPVVDGGDILGHYLPAIEPDDDPATLFAKTVGGAAKIAGAFLDHLEAGAGFTSCPQPPPLFYYRGADWTIHHGQRVRRAIDRRVVDVHLRAERLEPYWDAGDGDAARRRVNATLAALLGLAAG
jgi:hypothetical protein